MNPDETGSTLDKLIESGKVRAVGASNFKPWDWSLLQSRMSNKLLTNQIEFSLYAHQPLTNGDLSFHFEANTPIMAWSPLSGGKILNEPTELKKALTEIAKQNDTKAEIIAIAWILAHPSSILPIVGTNNLERIKTISKAMDINIDRKTWFKLYSKALGHEVD